MEYSHWRLCSVHTHVCLQVAPGGEGSATDLTLKRSLARMCAVVHLESALAAEHTVAYDALIGITKLVLNVVHELLKLRGF